MWQAMQALLAGRFEEATVRAQEALERGRRVRAPDAENSYVSQSLLAAIEMGRVAELRGTVEDMIERYPAITWSVARLRLYAELGQRAELAQAFDEVAAAGFATIMRNMVWLVVMTVLADSCAILGDAARAAELQELLSPYADRTVIGGEGWTCYGSAARPLARLAATRGRWDEAETYFRSALERNAALGARPWVARTQFGYAQMLLRRGRSRDAEPAQELLANALATAAELGMASLTAQVQAELIGATP
jgi:tetratricopeptide (TPR) repeat protein